jgi:hypothetical protein
MLQAGRRLARFPIRSLNFSVDLIHPGALLPLDPLSFLTEMSKMNLPGGGGVEEKYYLICSKNQNASVWIGFIWHRIGTDGRLLYRL